MTKHNSKQLDEVSSAVAMFRSRFRIKKAYATIPGSVWNNRDLSFYVNRVDFCERNTLKITFIDTDKFCFYRHIKMGKIDGARGCYVTLDIEMFDRATGKSLDVTRYNLWITLGLPCRSSLRYLSNGLSDEVDSVATTTVTAYIVDVGNPRDVHRITDSMTRRVNQVTKGMTWDNEYGLANGCYHACLERKRAKK